MTGLHKRFKDYSDLTALLRSRGMIVDDDRAIPVLRREGYYMIINGYKVYVTCRGGVCPDVRLFPSVTLRMSRHMQIDR
ncbi:hypothetical protein [Bifidobacterium thermophilum]|uniref:hypothetical protein n=1 Tax=Bifidobacterium thermophilum TaxID=33905 RepID=UPI0030ADBE38